MRLIDADNLIKDVQTEIAKSKHCYEDVGCRCFCRGMDHAIRIARQQPTIDHAKHGYWILDETIKNPRYQIKTCSLCGCRANGTQFNFCPSCGARMSDKVSDK